MSLAEALLDLQELTRQLRRECPWDRSRLRSRSSRTPSRRRTRSPTLRLPTTRRRSTASSAISSSRSTSSRCSSRSEEGRPRVRRTRGHAKLVGGIRTSSVNPRSHSRAGARALEAMKTEQEGPGELRDVPERPGAPEGPKGAAARGRGRMRLGPTLSRAAARKYAGSSPSSRRPALAQAGPARERTRPRRLARAAATFFTS